MNGRILRIPNGLLRAMLRRGVAIWIVSRMMAMSVFAMAASSGSRDFAVPTGLLLNMWTVAMTAGLVLLDFHRRKELMLLNNLGIMTSSAVVVATVPAVLAESLLVMLVA